MSDASRRLQESVTRARKQLSWSQRTLADRAGVGVETVRKLEGGRPSVTLAVLERVADALDTPLVMLLGGSGTSGPLFGWQSLPDSERALVQALVDYFSARTGGRQANG